MKHLELGKERGKNFVLSQFRGFTLIELMVVITISALLVGGGLAAYTNFNERQVMLAAGQALYNDLRFTQGKATASEKPEACGAGQPQEGVLERYELVFTSGNEYEINAWCGGQQVQLNLIRTLPKGIAIKSQEGVSFYILGKGAERKTFVIEGFSREYSIEVFDTGEIADYEFDTPPSPTPTPLASPSPSPSPSPGGPGPVGPGPGESQTMTFTPVADSFVNSNRRSRNYGTRSEIQLDGSPKKRIYLKFDLTLLSGESVTDAKLRMNVCDWRCNSTNTHEVKVVNDTSWREGSIKWNNRPGMGATLASVNGGNNGEWKEFDVTNYIVSKVGGLVSFGITQAGGSRLKYLSKEAVAGSWPELVVTYAGN